MLKVLTIVGTRPEIIRLSCIINKLDNCFNHKLVHTGQNQDFELNKIFFDEFNIRKPNFFLDCKGASATQKIGDIISKTDKIITSLNPDAIIILGDTNSSLSAIAAKKNKIPIFHLEAGNRCYDQRVPEEINRKIVDHISDINLTYSDIAKQNLLRENLPPFQVIKIGSPLTEVINNNKENIYKSKILSNLKLKKNNYFVFSAHREENIENQENFKKIINIINSLAEKYKLKIFFSVHPRTQKKIKDKKIKLNKLVKLSKPIGFSDYIKLQINAKVVISDSGSITEESSILKFPAITIRNSHERPEGMDAGVLIMSGLNKEKVSSAIDLTIAANKNKHSDHSVTDYDNYNVSNQVSKIIFSYIEFVNKNTWKK